MSHPVPAPAAALRRVADAAAALEAPQALAEALLVDHGPQVDVADQGLAQRDPAPDVVGDAVVAGPVDARARDALVPVEVRGLGPGVPGRRHVGDRDDAGLQGPHLAALGQDGDLGAVELGALADLQTQEAYDLVGLAARAVDGLRDPLPLRHARVAVPEVAQPAVPRPEEVARAEAGEPGSGDERRAVAVVPVGLVEDLVAARVAVEGVRVAEAALVLGELREGGGLGRRRPVLVQRALVRLGRRLLDGRRRGRRVELDVLEAQPAVHRRRDAHAGPVGVLRDADGAHDDAVRQLRDHRRPKARALPDDRAAARLHEAPRRDERRPRLLPARRLRPGELRRLPGELDGRMAHAAASLPKGRKEGRNRAAAESKEAGTRDAPLSGKGAQGPKTAKAAERTRRCDDGRDAPPKPDTTE